MAQLETYPVWDTPTRWFHWINVLCVITLTAFGLVILNASALGVGNPGKIALKTLHVRVGYVFTANLVFRFIWAFLGNRYARWRAFLPGGAGYLRALRRYTSALISGHPEQYAGHNPIGRLAVLVLLLLLLIQAVTGLLLAGTDIFYPPFGSWIAQWIAAPGIDPSTLVPYALETYDTIAYDSMRALRAPLVSIHLYGFYVLMAVVVVHVAGVVLTEVREGGSIISAMFSGRKTLARRPADADDRDGR